MRPVSSTGDASEGVDARGGEQARGASGEWARRLVAVAGWPSSLGSCLWALPSAGGPTHSGVMTTSSPSRGATPPATPPATPLATSTLQRAAGLASRAPSLHNSQPWAWRADGPLLHLYADRRRFLPRSDPDGRGLLLSCGIVLHHMRVALAASGWASTVERFPDPRDPDHVAALRVDRAVPSADDRTLAKMMVLRRSDRRRFSSWPVPDHHLEVMRARAAREGVVVERVETTPALVGAVHAAMEIHAGDNAYRAEIEGWSGSYRVVDGVPGRNVPRASISGAELPPRWFAAAALPQDPAGHLRDEAGTLLAVATPGDDRFSHLRAGEAASGVLLEATAAGLSSCPVSEPLELPATRQILQRAAMSSGCFPQLIIRVGWAPRGAAPLPMTPRRQVSDWLTVAPDASSREAPDASSRAGFTT